MQLPEDDTLVGAARDHLNLIGLIVLTEESDGGNRRAVIVEGLQKIVSLINTEYVNETIPRSARQQPRRIHRVSRESRVLEAEDLGVVRLDETDFLQRVDVVNSYVSRSEAEKNIFRYQEMGNTISLFVAVTEKGRKITCHRKQDVFRRD